VGNCRHADPCSEAARPQKAALIKAVSAAGGDRIEVRGGALIRMGPPVSWRTWRQVPIAYTYRRWCARESDGLGDNRNAASISTSGSSFLL